jgi:hypothetical protein
VSERGTNNGETQIKDHSEARCATNQRMEIVNTAALFLKQITQKWTLILLRFSTQLLRFSVPRAY